MPGFSFKMHQIQCRLRLPPDPAGGAYSAPPYPIARFGREGKRQDEGEEKRRGRKRGEGGRRMMIRIPGLSKS